jgi:hypothetical protein
MAVGDWEHTKKEKRYDDRQGQDLVTDFYEMLSATEPAVKTAKSGSFDRAFEYQDGLATYQESYYEGNTDPNDGFTYNTTLTQEPLETHPRYRENGDMEIDDSEWEKYRKFTDAGDSSWTPDQGTTEFKDFWELKQKGIDTWLSYSIEAQVTTIETNEPNIDKVGRIDTLPSPRAITLRGGRTWMLVSVDAEKLGVGTSASWRVTKTYRSSGEGGWNTDIYNNS